MYKAFAPNIKGAQTICWQGEDIKGEWVYGDLLKIPYNENGDYDCYIIEKVDFRDTIYDVYSYAHQVLAVTICEAIPGLKDKFGRQVFKNDVVTLHHMLGVYEVKWSENQCRYDLYRNGYPQAGLNPETIRNYAVIGTIFDKEN